MRVAYREGATIPVEQVTTHAAQIASGGEIDISLAVYPLNDEAGVLRSGRAGANSGSDSATDAERFVSFECDGVVREQLNRRELKAALTGLSGAAQVCGP